MAAKQKKARKLTAKQRRFIDEYLVDLNATQAAVRSGYSKKTARVIGTENLSKPAIAFELYRRLGEKRQETELSEKWVLDRLEELAERCLQHRPVLDSKGNPVYTETKSGKMVPAYTFDSAGAKGALELVGKHFATFVDRVRHEGELKITKIQRTIVDPKAANKR